MPLIMRCVILWRGAAPRAAPRSRGAQFPAQNLVVDFLLIVRRPVLIRAHEQARQRRRDVPENGEPVQGQQEGQCPALGSGRPVFGAQAGQQHAHPVQPLPETLRRAALLGLEGRHARRPGQRHQHRCAHHEPQTPAAQRAPQRPQPPVQAGQNPQQVGAACQPQHPQGAQPPEHPQDPQCGQQQAQDGQPVAFQVFGFVGRKTEGQPKIHDEQPPDHVADELKEGRQPLHQIQHQQAQPQEAQDDHGLFQQRVQVGQGGQAGGLEFFMRGKG